MISKKKVKKCSLGTIFDDFEVLFRRVEKSAKNESFSTPFLMQIRGFLVDIRETVVDKNRGVFGIEMHLIDKKSII